MLYYFMASIFSDPSMNCRTKLSSRLSVIESRSCISVFTFKLPSQFKYFYSAMSALSIICFAVNMNARSSSCFSFSSSVSLGSIVADSYSMISNAFSFFPLLNSHVNPSKTFRWRTGHAWYFISVPTPSVNIWFRSNLSEIESIRSRANCVTLTTNSGLNCYTVETSASSAPRVL